MEKQKILTLIIVVAIIGLIGLGGYVVYDEMQQKNTQTKTETISADKENQIQKEEPKEEENKEKQPKQEQAEGKEEKESNAEAKNEESKDDKAIALAKKTWGDDNSVTFNIEEKKGNLYYIAVKGDGAVISWYEVNTDTWEISDFY